MNRSFAVHTVLRRWAWRLAVLVLLLAALVPLLPRAMAYVRLQMAPWGQSCTTATSAAAPAPAGQPSGKPGG